MRSSLHGAADDASRRFDDPPGAHGYALRAASGPAGWRAVRAAGAAGRIAYAPDGETIRCAVGETLHVLDRQGRSAAEARVIASVDEWVVLAARTSRALVVAPGAMRVVELDEGRVVWSHAMARPLGMPSITARGTHVWSGARLLGVDDGSDRTFEGTVLAASPDGALVIVEDGFRRARLVRTADGAVLRDDLGGSTTSERVLDADGTCAMVEHRYTASAWHDRDAASPEWDEGKRVRISGPAGEGRVVLDVRGLCAVPSGGWVGSARRGLAHIARDASFRMLTAQGRVLAVSHDGTRAIVTGPTVGEIEIASGAFLSSSRSDAAIDVAWSALGGTALVRRASGRLERWDVAAWTSEPVPGVAPVGPMSVAPDGAIVIASPDQSVSCLEPSGATRWRHQLLPHRTGVCPPVAPVVDGTLVIVDTRWTRSLGVRADREEDIEELDVRTELDLATGVVRAEREVASVAPGRAPAALHELRRAPGWDRSLGSPTFVWPSPDASRVLVATDAGELLRLDRVGAPRTA